KKLKLVSDTEQQKEIRYKVASIYELEIKDNKKAIKAYQQILGDHGEELQAYKALDRIYQSTSDWQELAQGIQRELALVPPGDNASIVELKFRLGSIQEQHLDDAKGAIEQYRDILELEASHAGARQALERRLSDADHQLTAAGILELIYQQLGEWARLIEVHEIQLAREKAPSNPVSLLLRIRDLQAGKISDREKALDA